MESTLQKPQKPVVCYRCRKSSSKTSTLVACDLCALFWHLGCISPSLQHDPPTGHWMCPQHQKPSKRQSPGRKRVSKIKAREATTESLEEADEFLKYGGVLHSILAETVEGDFLRYAKRYRQFNHSERNRKRHKLHADKWLDKLTCVQLNDTDGIQMLIDAANVQSDNNTYVNLDETQLKRFEAIQELVNIKGEGVVMDILSKTL
ncbi:uncharacterized protein EV154DRAFT_559616 [Mucor mucedo]|uniref:uncharacterized protein n=1 Tax=Mucor mucedo TaxID=29922 RepID=UPI00221F339E|nr:uncharacterized protein EV154DRAFT_559616 [Mucor mucedo]KAI7895200.1 hypothetical protein EV154DRAFT_559616 [Mucor mucedo]